MSERVNTCNVVDIIESNCECIFRFIVNIDERIGVPYKYEIYLFFFILLVQNFQLVQRCYLTPAIILIQ